MQPRLAQCIDVPRKLEGFACGHCHRVKFLSRLQPEAWNDVIAYLTAGLLYGREVPRPDWFTKDRKRPYKPLINARPALQRERVLERLLEGHPRAKIAADLRMTYGAVSQQMWKIFKQEKVRTHRALLRKHNRPFPPHLQLSADKVLADIQAGLSQDDIARKMGITRQAVQSYTSKLYKSGRLPRPKRKRDAVARLLAEGRSNKEIAQALGMGIQNVYDHRSELRVAKRRAVLDPTVFDTRASSDHLPA
jgi:DNA-binding NarL/FixJ family response regulator